MALFKILSNMTDKSKALPTTYHQGYCYFDVNTGKFWIDTTDAAAGRMAINAYKSDRATLSDAAIYETTEAVNAPLHKINEYYGHGLSLSGTTLSLVAGDNSTTLSSIALPPNTHWTTHLRTASSATATTQVTAATSNPYLNLLDNSTVRDSIRFVGSGTTTIQSSADGKTITISSADSKTGTVTSITPGNGLLNGTTTNAITTSGTLNINYGTTTAKIGTAAAGSATTVSRSDHVHAIDLATGDANGQVKIAGTNVSVKGLGSNAYTSTAYLPLAGGTMTGDITFSKPTTAGQKRGFVFSGVTDSAGLYYLEPNLNDDGRMRFIMKDNDSDPIEMAWTLYRASGNKIPGEHVVHSFNARGYTLSPIIEADGTKNPISIIPSINNFGSVGTSSNKWADMYATTFHGALDGNASSASAVKDYNNNTLTKFGYSTSGMTSTSWLGSWDASTSGEYRLRAISPANAIKSGIGTTAIGKASLPVYWNGSNFATITSYEGKAATAGTATKATAANIATTQNSIAKYSNTTGTFANSGVTIDSNNNLIVPSTSYAQAGNITIGGATGSDQYTIKSNTTLQLDKNANTSIIFSDNGTEKIRIDTNNAFRPEVDSTLSIGTENYKWNNIYANTYNGAMANSITIGDKFYNGSEDVTLFASDLGVSSALNFAGVIYETLPNRDETGYPSTQNPVHLYIATGNHQGSTIGDGSAGSINPGTVVICHDTQDEFLWSEDSQGNQGWYSLGLASSFALHNHTHGNIENAGTMAATINGVSSANKAVVTDASNAITIADLSTEDPTVQNNAASTSFISSITQDSKGKITAVKSNISDVYVYNTGDTMTGNLTVCPTDGSYVEVKDSTKNVSVYLHASTGGFTGIYSDGYWNGSTKIADAQWLVYRDTNGNICLNGIANQAIQDGNGNTITSTYVKKSGDTMTGNLNMGTTDQVNGRHISFDGKNSDGTATRHVWMGYANGVNSWYLYDMTNAKAIIHSDSSGINTFYGTADKANKDGSGNTISSTYVKKSGDTMTGNLVMYTSSSGASPAIIFQRGTFTDTYNDWRIQDSGGLLYFGQRGSGSSDFDSTIYFDNSGEIHATKVWGAVWNDYAEYRKDNAKEEQEPGRCVREVGDGTLALTTKRLERGCEIISDTFGFAIGQDEENGYNTPIASNGRVLAYPYESIEEFASHIGYPVCSGPDGTVSIMTDEEEEKYPSRIIGTISEIPSYEEWGTGKVKVNGRVWIRIK